MNQVMKKLAHNKKVWLSLVVPLAAVLFSTDVLAMNDQKIMTELKTMSGELAKIMNSTCHIGGAIGAVVGFVHGLVKMNLMSMGLGLISAVVGWKLPTFIATGALI